LHKKLENARALKLYQKHNENKDNDLKELAEIEQKERLEKFLKSEGKLVSSSVNSSNTATTSKSSNDSKQKSVSNMTGDLSKKLPSFWIPSLCPESNTQAPVKKPVSIFIQINLKNTGKIYSLN